MNLFSSARRAFKTLPIRLVDAENTLMRILSLTGELVRAVDGLRRDVEPTFVYVLPPSSGSGPMSAKSVSVPKGSACRIDFNLPGADAPRLLDGAVPAARHRVSALPRTGIRTF